MADKTDLPMIEGTAKEVSRRDFIIGVIAGGAAVSTGYYLFRALRGRARDWLPVSASGSSR